MNGLKSKEKNLINFLTTAKPNSKIIKKFYIEFSKVTNYEIIRNKKSP